MDAAEAVFSASQHRFRTALSEELKARCLYVGEEDKQAS